MILYLSPFPASRKWSRVVIYYLYYCCSVQRAHDEFQRYFKQAKDRKKKSPELDAKK
jgi:hypothetical protein